MLGYPVHLNGQPPSMPTGAGWPLVVMGTVLMAVVPMFDYMKLLVPVVRDLVQLRSKNTTLLTRRVFWTSTASTQIVSQRRTSSPFTA
ncbi:hypothetical protein N7510_011319 [Penicillium lagena]|uniref:uncharacterized protein n=1 Tax=Penicillium lagena TaxID=94218 RepID=UPI002540B59B|nr:uncharacterized protein N7510_011319 [Penicillium lagena]KAJ5601785.1 hypothetical protein N7510_011319 [Penicillium lagena]